MIPVLIAAISALAALSGGCAARLSNEASDARQQHLHDVLRLRARDDRIAAQVEQDLLLLPRYKQHLDACTALLVRARKIRSKDGALADMLEASAQGELALARVARGYVSESEELGWGCPRGSLTMPNASQLRSGLRRSDPGYGAQAAAVQESEARADSLRGRVNELVAATAVMFLTLLFLTVARVPYRATSLPFLVLGVLAAATSMGWFVLAIL